MNRAHLPSLGLVLCAAVGCPQDGGDAATDTSTASATDAGTDSPSTGPGGTDAGGTDVADSVDSGPGSDCVPTEEGVRQSIIEPMCATAACHDATSAAGGLDLSVEELEAALASTPSGTCDGQILLVPGDADASFLHARFEAQPACGGSMPPGTALDAAQQDCLAEWIALAQTVCETCGEAACVDNLSSPDHCGECGRACPAGVPCVEGMCACPEGTTACGPECVDTESDPAHCGDCDEPCDPGLFCLAGGCTNDCGGLSECSGACVDLEVNPLHCGDCDAPCGAAETCQAGACGCQAPPTSYAEDIEPFLSADCAAMGCHRPMGPNDGAAGLNLQAGSGYDALVNVPSTQCGDCNLVEPGSPANSYLYDKVLGINLCFGTAMPKVGAGLSPAELQSVSDWICAGAAP